MDNPLSRQEPGPTSRVTPEALYSETVSGYTFSPRIRTGIAAGPNLQLIGLGFTRNLLLKKVSPDRQHASARWSCAGQLPAQSPRGEVVTAQAARGQSIIFHPPRGCASARACTALVRSGVQYNNKTMRYHFGAAHSCSSFADLVIKN